MQRSKAFLPALIALAALQACASARGGPALGGAPAESAWLASVGGYSALELRRPAYVALVEFDEEGARVVTASDQPMARGRHTLATPGLRRLSNQSPGVCNRQGEVAVPSGAEIPPGSPLSRRPSRRARPAHVQPDQRGLRCLKTVPRHVEEAHRHLLLVTSDVPFATGFRARVPEVARTFAEREALDAHAVAAELARALAPAGEEQWTARVYPVVSTR